MSDYFYLNGDILTNDVVVGWLNTAIPNQFECVAEIKKVLEKYHHTLSIVYFRSDFEKLISEPALRENENGQYITGKHDDITYAYFSINMRCAKLCVNAIFKLLSGAE